MLVVYNLVNSSGQYDYERGCLFMKQTQFCYM